MKKIIAAALSAVMLISLAACGSKTQPAGTTAAEPVKTTAAKEEKPAETTAAAKETTAAARETTAAPEKTTAATKEEGFDFDNFKIRHEVDPSAKFVIKYPEKLAAKFGASLELPKYPEKLVVLSTSTLYLLKKLDVKPIAVSRQVKTTLAADTYGSLPTIDSGMNGVDTEAIIALKPDLVLMSAMMKEKYGSILEELKIPVYYTSEGPIVTYDMNKEESLCLAEAFGGKVARDDVAKVYGEVEKKAMAYKESHKPQTEMILFGMDFSYQASSMSFFGSILKSLGFENLTDKNEGPQIRVAPGSMEKVISYNPQVLFLIAPPTGYDPSALKDAFLAKVNSEKDLWKNVDAVKSGHIFAFGGNYTTSKGLQVVHDISALIDSLDQALKG